MNTTVKGKRPHTPHCRGGVSSMLRVAAAGGTKAAVSSSGFGLLESQALVQRMARAMVIADPVEAAKARPSDDTSHPMFRRGSGDDALWRSSSFGAKAVWQDSRIAMD
jgi:hypothetical protein